MSDDLFGILLKDHSYFVNFARRINQNLGEDAVQDAFMRVYRVKDSLVDRNVQAYMKSAIRHSIINELRKKYHNDVPLNFDVAVDEPRDSFDPDLCSAVQSAIDELPLHYRTVISGLCEGLSYLDIANRNGIPLGTVMSRVYRAREIVKSKLEKYLH